MGDTPSITRRQCTIGKPVSYEGTGLHTGTRVRVTFRPAPVDDGVRFVRTDLPQHPEVHACVENVIDTTRGTNLGQNGIEVHTVEHIMAAVFGLEIDNLTIELDSNEIPAGDGSAAPFVEALLRAGLVEQEAPRDYLALDKPIAYSDPEGRVDLVAFPSEDFRVTYMLDYEDRRLPSQYTHLGSLREEFVEEYAPARTFGFLSEVEELWKQGLVKGGSLDNAIVIVDREIDQAEMERLKELFGLEGEVFSGTEGILSTEILRFDNEPCRHKVLDLMGDLALLGVPLKVHVLASRSGHRSNIELVRRIRQFQERREIQDRYKQKPAEGFFLDIRAIQQIMPHRYPLLLVDRILELVPRQRVVGIKNVTVNEPFFQGHFPDYPIMPGILIVEAMAQVGGVLLLNTVDNPEDKLVYFVGFDGVRFRRPVLPGDQLRSELRLLKLKRNTCKMEGKAYVGGDLVAEATLMATIVDKEG